MDRLAIARAWTAERLVMLRQSLRGEGFDAFVVPRWDRCQSEYCAVEDERLAWMSGFSGTWGLGFVTMSRAAPVSYTHLGFSSPRAASWAILALVPVPQGERSIAFSP